MYALDIQSIYKIEINSVLEERKIVITIRYRESRQDYLDRLEISINFQDDCMN